jgi:hypothetical protein
MAARKASARKGRKKKPAEPPAATSIDLKDPRTGQVKRIPVGFAWDLFSFPGCSACRSFCAGCRNGAP